MNLLTRCLLVLLFPACMFAQVQKEADTYAAQKLPMGGIVILQSEGGAMQLGVAGKISAQRPGAPEIDSVFEVGSVSKLFTAVLLAESVRLNKVLLEDTVDIHLPAGTLGPDNPLRKTTLKQLSTHTSGLPRLPDNLATTPGFNVDNPYAHYDADALYAFLKTLDDKKLKPGNMAYSNLGAGLLGHLLERAWKKSYREILREIICEPLGMEHTDAVINHAELDREMRALLVPPHMKGRTGARWDFDALIGAGGIISSAEDLMKFAEALWSPQTPAGLKASLELTTQTHAKSGKQEIGLGWFIQDSSAGRMLLHDGATGGYQSVIRVMPEKKFARIELVNQSLTYTQSLNSKTEIKGKDVDAVKAFWLDNLGVWKGTLKVSDTALLRLELHIIKNEEGGLRYQLFSPDQHPDPIPVSAYKQDGNDVTFTVQVVGGVFKGTLSENEQQMDGTWKQGAANIPLTLIREK